MFSVFCNALAEELLVSSLSDEGENSLRAALNAAGDGDVISFVPELSGGVIQLSEEIKAINKKNIIIDGTGVESRITIDAEENSRHLRVDQDSELTIKSLVLKNGAATRANGADGGAIYNEGNLTLVGCEISNCRAAPGESGFPEARRFGGGGGAIYNKSNLTIIECEISQNTAGIGLDSALETSQHAGHGGDGGGIYNEGRLTLRRCIIEGNTAPGGGSASQFPGNYSGL